jgi:hypothetical protein
VERPGLHNIFEVLQHHNMTRGIHHATDTRELDQPAALAARRAPTQAYRMMAIKVRG